MCNHPEVTEKMKKLRVDFLLKYLSENQTSGDVKKAESLLLSTKTYKALDDLEQNFYWKSIEELTYLLQMELEGNMAAWEEQVF